MTNEERKIQRILERLVEIGPMLPGSISKQWNVCGTSGLTGTSVSRIVWAAIGSGADVGGDPCSPGITVGGICGCSGFCGSNLTMCSMALAANGTS